jgi:hypothetical protein
VGHSESSPKTDPRKVPILECETWSHSSTLISVVIRYFCDRVLLFSSTGFELQSL